MQAFLNTLDLARETDELESPRALSEWLASRGLLAAGTELDGADLERAIRLRETLRALFSTRAAAPPKIREELEQAAAPALLQARFPPAGGIRLEPVASGLDETIARWLAILIAAQGAGRWPLLRICANDACRAAFYDYSTNHSGRWCRQRCGNRFSARAARRRMRRRG